MHLVIVTGARDFPYPQIVHRALHYELCAHGPFTLYHGACEDRETGKMTGADSYADEWGHTTPGIEVVTFPARADFDRWGNRGGPIRNRRMVKTAVLTAPRHDIQGLAFPGPRSKGTWNCVSIMKEFHIETDVWGPVRVNNELAAMAREKQP